MKTFIQVFEWISLFSEADGWRDRTWHILKLRSGLNLPEGDLIRNENLKFIKILKSKSN